MILSAGIFVLSCFRGRFRSGKYGPRVAFRVAMFAVAGVGLAHPASAASVQWHDSLDQARSESRPSNKPMWLDFWAAWCAPCKVMDAEVYTSDDVVQASERFVPVRIDFDKKTVLARKYNVTALPTLLFTDSDGNELFRFSGAIGAASLAELLRSLPHDVEDFNRLGRILASDKNNGDALERMGAGLKAAGLFRTSNDYYERALQQKSVKADAGKRQAILIAIGSNALEIREGRQAAIAYARCLREFPGSPHALEWQLSLGRAYMMDENTAKARKYLEAFVHDHPGSAESEAAQRLLGR